MATPTCFKCAKKNLCTVSSDTFFGTCNSFITYKKALAIAIKRSAIPPSKQPNKSLTYKPFKDLIRYTVAKES